MKCTTCKRSISPLEEFPGGDCTDCYEVKMANVPLSELPKPDFKQAIQKRG